MKYLCFKSQSLSLAAGQELMSLRCNSGCEGNPSGAKGTGRRRSYFWGWRLLGWSCSAGTYQLPFRVTHCSSPGVKPPLKGFSSSPLSGSVFLQAGIGTYTDEEGRDGGAVLDVDHGQQAWQVAFPSTRETQPGNKKGNDESTGCATASPVPSHIKPLISTTCSGFLMERSCGCSCRDSWRLGKGI